MIADDDEYGNVMVSILVAPPVFGSFCDRCLSKTVGFKMVSVFTKESDVQCAAGSANVNKPPPCARLQQQTNGSFSSITYMSRDIIGIVIQAIRLHEASS